MIVKHYAIIINYTKLLGRLTVKLIFRVVYCNIIGYFFPLPAAVIKIYSCYS